MTALPPLLAGTLNETVACPFPAVAAAAVGGPGVVAGVAEFEAEDAGPVPTLLVAATVNV